MDTLEVKFVIGAVAFTGLLVGGIGLIDYVVSSDPRMSDL